jgi:hypothetical protein
LDSFNKFLEVPTNKLSGALPPYREVVHKMEVVLGLALLSKAPYNLNQKELDFF